MIVLGPHVLAPPKEESDTKEMNSSIEAEKPIESVSELPSYCLDVTTLDNLLKQWKETRLEVSKMLGSIGAPPLSSPSATYCNQLAMTSSDVISDNSSYLDVISQLTSAHVDLIQTTKNALETLGTCTSLRLGLGPPSANRRILARTEKAWCEQQRKQHYPKLPLSKSRRIIHQTMIDQATSLRATLTCVDTPEIFMWDEFIDDMQYFSELNANQSAPVLTLAKLSDWLDGLRGLLSFALSHLLSQTHDVQTSGSICRVGLLKQSVQLAEERNQYLQSAFDLTRSVQIDSSEKMDSKPNSEDPSDESKRQAFETIQQLSSTLEAAQKSLWAMSQSYLLDNKQSSVTGDCDDDPKVWWFQLKELLTQTEAYVDYFQSTFLPDPVKEKNEKPAQLSEEPPCAINNASNTVNNTELVEDVPKRDDVATMQNQSIHNEHADKTWIFSASGIYKKTYRASKPQSTSRSNFDQTMLMRDLQKRLNTIELAKEHDAVKLDATVVDKVDLKSEEQQPMPFFMGVQGSLLTELTSALKGDDSQITLTD